MCIINAHKSYKSLAISLLFTIFFGPIGLLYATFWGAVLMLLFIFISLFIPHGGGTLLTLFWVICSYWGAWAVNQHNQALDAKQTTHKS